MVILILQENCSAFGVGDGGKQLFYATGVERAVFGKVAVEFGNVYKVREKLCGSTVYILLPLRFFRLADLTATVTYEKSANCGSQGFFAVIGAEYHHKL